MRQIMQAVFLKVVEPRPVEYRGRGDHFLPIVQADICPIPKNKIDPFLVLKIWYFSLVQFLLPTHPSLATWWIVNQSVLTRSIISPICSQQHIWVQVVIFIQLSCCSHNYIIILDIYLQPQLPNNAVLSLIQFTLYIISQLCFRHPQFFLSWVDSSSIYMIGIYFFFGLSFSENISSVPISSLQSHLVFITIVGTKVISLLL